MTVEQKGLSAEEFRSLIRLAKRVVWCDRDLKQKIQNSGLHIIPARFYSEVPTVEEVENSFEFREIETGAFNSEKIFKRELLIDFIHKIKKFSHEFDAPLDGDKENPTSYFWKNPSFSFSDAMAYYCIIRYFQPKQILEIGSGFSTLVADMAIRKNGFGNLILIEPYPMPFLKNILTVKTIVEKFVQDISVPEMVDLVEQGEIWFIDSTHTVKHGSDCLYMYLKVMPELRKDMIIHTHDIHLPFPFTKEHLIERNITWTEQYLLYAYLLDNPKVDILFGSAYSHRFLQQDIAEFMDSKFSSGGGSLWYFRRGQ